MRAVWASLGLVTTTLARLNMMFYSAELDEDLVISQMPNAKPIKEPSQLEIVDTVLQLTKRQGRSMSSVYVEAIRAAAYQEQANRLDLPKRSGVSPLAVSGSIYAAPVTIGSNTFQLVVDTGSSDPWVASSGFSCLDVMTKYVEDQAYCAFGPLYNQSKSSTFQQIPNLNFNVSYADGENLNGIMGRETISIANITIPSQEFGVVMQAAWIGDGTSSGLVGFAYSTLTSAYPGTDPTKDVRGKQLAYTPLFTNIYQQGLAAPIFSLALSRSTSSGGLLAIGGIPNIQHSPAFITVPIQPVGINATSNQLVYQYYSILIDGWAFSASQSAQFDVAGNNNPLKTSLVGNGTQVIVDSGTTLIYLANSVAASVAATFSPPAIWDDNLQAYTVSCTATAPVFGATIGKKVFYVNPVDLFLGLQNSDQCLVGIQPNFGGLTILGDVWLKSVLAVFDLGAEQMRFSAREFYDTPPCNGNNCVGTS